MQKEKRAVNIILSSREVIARDLPHPTPLFNEEQHFMREAEDPGQKISGMTPNLQGVGPVFARPAKTGAPLRSGFTLIELLVVVLIIGILAAVALPQYQKAVDKSRFSNLMAITNALAQANEVYYLANGTYTTDFEALAVDIPATSISGSTATFDWGTCILSGQQEVICFATTHLNNAYSVYYTHSSFSSWANHTYCVALTNEAGSRFDKVCSSLGTFKQVADCSTGPCRVYTLK